MLIPNAQIKILLSDCLDYDLSVIRKHNTFEVKTKNNNFETHRLEDLVAYCEALLESKRQKEFGLCSIHAAVATKNGKSVVIFGQSDSGKTSLALYLRKLGWLFPYDEKVLISLDRKTICGGRQFVKAAQHLLDNGLLSASRGSWLPLDAIDPEINISMFVIPMLNVRSNFLETRQLDVLDFCWDFYPEISASISFPRPIDLLEQGIVLNIDTLQLASWRARTTKKLCSEIKCLKIAGSFILAANYLDKELF